MQAFKENVNLNLNDNPFIVFLARWACQETFNFQLSTINSNTHPLLFNTRSLS